MQTIKDVMRVPTHYVSTDEVSELLDTHSMESLASHLPPDESVIDLGLGIHNDEIGTLAITDKRVIFVNEALVRTKIIDISYENIIAASSIKNLFLGSVLIQHSDGVFIIEKLSRRHARRLARRIDTIATKKHELFIETAK